MQREDELKYSRLRDLSKGNYTAFLYDCDGTLADNMGDHKETYVKVAAESGVKISPEIIDEFAGLPIVDVVKEINKRYKSNLNPEEFEARKTDLFYNEYISKTLPIQFVVDHLKASVGNHKIGVVSGSARKTVEKTLEVLGITGLIDVLVCAGDTPRGKPFPDPFLFAAKTLGTDPNSCIVFEDGEAGVKAAEAAGMRWIRIDQLAASEQ